MTDFGYVGSERQRLHLVSCEIFYREICALVAMSPHTIELTFVPQGLHDLPNADMTERLQTVVDSLETTDQEAVLLGYGLCNNGLAGLRARDLPLILPRAHDCITLFMGDRQRYLDYFHANPGVYFMTTGWIERDRTEGDLQQHSIQHDTGMDQTYQQLVEKYGKDNADFLFEQLQQQATEKYATCTFIEMGVEPDGRFEQQARQHAANRGWGFRKLEGDMGLLRRLVNGPWNEADFLTVPPGHEIAPSYGDDIVKAVPID